MNAKIIQPLYTVVDWMIDKKEYFQSIDPIGTLRCRRIEVRNSKRVKLRAHPGNIKLEKIV